MATYTDNNVDVVRLMEKWSERAFASTNDYHIVIDFLSTLNLGTWMPSAYSMESHRTWQIQTSPIHMDGIPRGRAECF